MKPWQPVGGTNKPRKTRDLACPTPGNRTIENNGENSGLSNPKLRSEIENAAPSAKGTALEIDKAHQLPATDTTKKIKRASLQFYWDHASNSIQPLAALCAGIGA